MAGPEDPDRRGDHQLRRVQGGNEDGQSLAPQTATVRRYLPPEFLRARKYAIERAIARGGMGAILEAQEATDFWKEHDAKKAAAPK